MQKHGMRKEYIGTLTGTRASATWACRAESVRHDSFDAAGEAGLLVAPLQAGFRRDTCRDLFGLRSSSDDGSDLSPGSNQGADVRLGGWSMRRRHPDKIMNKALMAYYDKGWELVRMTPHYRLRHPEFGYTDTMSCSPKNPSGAYKSAMKKLNTYNYEGDAR